MRRLTIPPFYPYFLGAFVIYAPNLYDAREIYHVIDIDDRKDPSGIKQSNSGQDIPWVGLKPRTCLIPAH